MPWYVHRAVVYVDMLGPVQQNEFGFRGNATSASVLEERLARIHDFSQSQSQDEESEVWAILDGIVTPLYTYFRDPDTVQRYHLHHRLDAPAHVPIHRAQTAPRPMGQRQGGRRSLRQAVQDRLPLQDHAEAGSLGTHHDDHAEASTSSTHHDDHQGTGYQTPPVRRPIASMDDEGEDEQHQDTYDPTGPEAETDTTQDPDHTAEEPLRRGRRVIRPRICGTGGHLLGSGRQH